MIYQQLSAPLHTQIELTTICNNKCRHCYNYQKQAGHPETTMDINDLEYIMKKLSTARVFTVTLTGGEPLLFPDLVLRAAALCNHYKIPFGINSNLTTFDDNLLKELAQYGKFSVLTSIASCREKTHDYLVGRKGAFCETVETIKKIVSKGVDVSVNMVITRKNSSDVYETGRFSYELGAKYFNVTKACCPAGCEHFDHLRPTKEDILQSLDDALRVQQDFKISVDSLTSYPHCVLKNLEKYSSFTHRKCSAGKIDCAIGPNGEVRPCPQSDMIYGNILEDDLSNIYSKMTDWLTDDLLPKICVSCPQFIYCGGGCRYDAKAMGDIAGMDPLATNPNDVYPLIERPVSIKLDNRQKIYFPKSVSYRKEEFGAIFYNHATGTSVLLDHDASEIVSIMLGKEACFHKILQVAGCDYNDGVEDVFQSLIQNSIAVVV